MNGTPHAAREKKREREIERGNETTGDREREI
jgi:hypothetical protein